MSDQNNGCFTCEDCGEHFMNPVRLDPDPDAEEEARGTL